MAVQRFLTAACKALEAVDVVSHKTPFGQELGHKAADAHLPDDMKVRSSLIPASPATALQGP